MNTKEESDSNEPVLSTSTRMLVSIAAAIAFNCGPCLETLVPGALQYGIEPEEIGEVISAVADIRDNVLRLNRDSVARLLGSDTGEESRSACCEQSCECAQPVASPGARRRRAQPEYGQTNGEEPNKQRRVK